MFILEKPFVSEFLFQTIVKNEWNIIDNPLVRSIDVENGAISIIPSNNAKNYYLAQEFPLLYTNSENGIDWVLENLPMSNTAEYIRIFKNKTLFRDKMVELYPDFYYKNISYEELKNIVPKKVKFPIVIKPNSGTMSLGVRHIKDENDLKGYLLKVEKEFNFVRPFFSGSVIDTDSFIIEEDVMGEEYSIDAYFDRNGDAVILGIFQHPISDPMDTRKRIYMTSSTIILKFLAKFQFAIRNIGQAIGIRNFPINIEVRVKDNGEIVPIEVNPMRFASFCNSDITKKMWGFNIYEYYYLQQCPDWNEILSRRDTNVYYYSTVEVPQSVNVNQVEGFKYESFLDVYRNIIELRKNNFSENLVFANVFGIAKNIKEVAGIIAIDTENYLISK